MADAVIEIEDAEGRKVTVSRAHWDRYPQLAESFRPVPKSKPKPKTKPKAKLPAVVESIEPEPSR